MNLLELSEQEIIRRNSMEQLRQMGIEPYPAAEYVANAFSKEIKETFKDDAEPRPVSIAGRIMSRRIMGKASFMELQDSEGRIQVYISRDDICPDENKDTYNVVFKKLLDIGDFVGIKGFVFLRKISNTDSFAYVYISFVRLDVACYKFHKRGFAASVRSDNSNSVSAKEVV